MQIYDDVSQLASVRISAERCIRSPAEAESKQLQEIWVLRHNGGGISSIAGFFCSSFVPSNRSLIPATARSNRSRSSRSAKRTTTVRSALAQEFSALDRVDILSEALPFIQRFQRKTVVVKYGGAAMKDPTLKEGVIKDLVLLSCVGLRPVLVHGGGPEINTWLTRIGIEPNFKNGLRVTDGPTMEVVEMVLVGKVNKSLVSLINRAGGTAVGMCGKDGRMITARQASADLGFVGDISSIDTTVVKGLVRDGIIPVIATVAADSEGQAYNVNADTAAGEIAASLGAEKLILMTDVPGVMIDPKDLDSLVKEVDIKGIRKLIADGIVKGGMIPKVECCIRSLAQGVHSTAIIDGRKPHSLLLEVLTDEGAGTMITGPASAVPRLTVVCALRPEKWDATVYGNLSERAMKERLQAEGYSVTRYAFPPGTEFPEHTHGVHKKDSILSGRFLFRMDGRDMILEAGDCIEVPAGKPHYARVVGNEAVIFFDASRFS
ncbi:unnamed protein product [Closterium sp. NIES-53]